MKAEHPGRALAGLGNPLATCRALYEFTLRYRREAESLKILVAQARDVTGAAYKRLAKTDREDFDRQRKRLALKHVVADRPAIRQLRFQVRQQLERADLGVNNCLGGVAVTGPGGSGKSTAVSVIAREVLEQELTQGLAGARTLEDLRQAYLETVDATGTFTAPFTSVVTTSMPGNVGSKVFLEGVIKSIATLHPQVEVLKKSARGADLMLALAGALNRFGCVLLVVDEVHFIRDTNQGSTVINTIKDLLNRSNVVLLVAGVKNKQGNLRFLDGAKAEAQEQLTRRFQRVAIGSLPDPTESDDLKQLLRVFAWKTVLLDQEPSWWRDDDLIRYVYQRTGGVMEHVVRLFDHAAQRVIGGEEQLDIGILDQVRISGEADHNAAEEFHIGPDAGGRRRTANWFRNDAEGGDDDAAPATV